MKKQKLLIILILVILISGCVKYDLQMQVNTDKSFNFVLIDAMLNEYAGMETQDQTTADEYKAKGFEVENYSDNEYTGLKLTKKYNSIDEVSSSNCGTVELKNIIEQEGDMILFKSQKNNTLTTYTADFTYDLTVKEGSNEDYSAYSEQMYFGYTITLPTNSKIISNNADKVSEDGYTLTWEMEYGQKKDIDFVFTIDDKDVTATPNNNQNNNQNNAPNNQNQNNEEIEEEAQKPQEELEVKVTFSSIIALILVLGVIGGLIYLKYKTSSKARYSKKNINNPSVLYHATPPNNNKNK